MPGAPVLFSTRYFDSTMDAEFLSRSDMALIQKLYSPTFFYLLSANPWV